MIVLRTSGSVTPAETSDNSDTPAKALVSLAALKPAFINAEAHPSASEVVSPTCDVSTLRKAVSDSCHHITQTHSVAQRRYRKSVSVVSIMDNTKQRTRSPLAFPAAAVLIGKGGETNVINTRSISFELHPTKSVVILQCRRAVRRPGFA